MSFHSDQLLLLIVITDYRLLLQIPMQRCMGCLMGLVRDLAAPDLLESQIGGSEQESNSRHRFYPIRRELWSGYFGERKNNLEMFLSIQSGNRDGHVGLDSRDTQRTRSGCGIIACMLETSIAWHRPRVQWFLLTS